MESDRLIVGIGEMAVADHPKVLVSEALGSCVAITLWDPILWAGGMAHVMLPDHTGSAVEDQPWRFVTSAIPGLVDRLADAGSPKGRLIAKLAGGAAMFRCDSSGIGARNVLRAREELKQLGIPLRAEDTGMNYARTIEFHLDTGILLVRSYTCGLRSI